jgi:hypothetical protein
MKNYNAWRERGNSETPEAIYARSLTVEEKLNFCLFHWGKDYRQTNPDNGGGYIGKLNYLVVLALNKLKKGVTEI